MLKGMQAYTDPSLLNGLIIYHRSDGYPIVFTEHSLTFSALFRSSAYFSPCFSSLNLFVPGYSEAT